MTNAANRLSRLFQDSACRALLAWGLMLTSTGGLILYVDWTLAGAI